MVTRNEREGLWTADQVAAYVGLHPQTVYAKARAGEIPSLKIGRALRFRPAEIDQWVEDSAERVATNGTAGAT